MPLECHHHLKKEDISEYREGVILKRPVKKNKGSWVDIGLFRDCQIEQKIPPNIRVTVKIQNYEDNYVKFYKGNAISTLEAEKATEMFWGFNIENAHTFSECFKNLSENTLKILINKDNEQNFTENLKNDINSKITSIIPDDIFILFTGEGLQTLFDNDESTKTKFQSIRNRFDYEFNPYFEDFGFKNIYLDEQIRFYSNIIFN